MTECDTKNVIYMSIHANVILTSNQSPRSMFCIGGDKSDTGNSSITYQDVLCQFPSVPVNTENV